MRWIAVLLSSTLALVLTGCGGSGSPLTVFAAASLRQPLTRFAADDHAATLRLSFAGSDRLAAQIRQGLRPDLFLAANSKIPDALYAEHRVERPVPFAINALVLAVPADAHRVSSLADLTRPGITLAIGSPTVPVGDTTRAVLSRLGPARAAGILVHVRTQEPDVSGVVGKLAAGAVDAGFVYASDVTGSGGRLRAIPLPPALDPRVTYEGAVVVGAPHPGPARALLGRLAGPTGRRVLTGAGFGPPPGG